MNLLEQWKWNETITVDRKQFLTPDGRNVLKQLATRYQKAFPRVMEKTYDSKKFKFYYTDKQRTKESCDGFIDGWFGGKQSETISIPPPLEKELVLKVSKYLI